MLNRIASTPTWAPAHWGAWRRELLTGPLSALLRYVLALLVLCLVGCLYLLQANDLARLNEDIVQLEAQAAQLEQQNLALKLQLAQWNSPAYIRDEALKRNYVKNPDVLYVNIDTATDATTGVQSVTQTAQANNGQTMP